MKAIKVTEAERMEMDRIASKEQGLKMMMDAQTYAAASIAKSKNDFWQKLGKKYKIDITQQEYFLNTQTGMLAARKPIGIVPPTASAKIKRKN